MQVSFILLAMVLHMFFFNWWCVFFSKLILRKVNVLISSTSCMWWREINRKQTPTQHNQSTTRDCRIQRRILGNYLVLRLIFSQCIHECRIERIVRKRYIASKFSPELIVCRPEKFLTHLCPASSIEHVWPKFQF